MNIMDVGLFPLLGQWFQKFIKLIGHILFLCFTFLFGPRKSIKELTSEELNTLYLNVTVGSAIGTGLLALVAFSGNFKLIADLSHAHGIPWPMGFLIPLALDGFVLISIATVLGGALVGQNTKIIKLLVFLSSVTSAYFNVSHVLTESDNLEWLTVTLHCVLGIFLYLAVEVTAHQITNYIKRRAILKTNEVLQEEIDVLLARKSTIEADLEAERAVLVSQVENDLKSHRTELNVLLEEIERAKNDHSAFTIDHLKVAHLLGKAPTSTGQQIATIINKKSPASGNAIKREIKEVLNGNFN